MQQKGELREAILQRLRAMTPSERAAESRTICRRVQEFLNQDVILNNRSRGVEAAAETPRSGVSKNAEIALCVYAALPTEPDLQLLLTDLFEKDVAVFFPRFEAGRNAFRRVRQFTELVPGSFGILEPLPSAELLPVDQSCIALIPGRAFDAKGGRLGRGNGGYDHWIHDRRACGQADRFFGVCFQCQIVQKVPMEAHDELVDGVVTGRGIMFREVM